MVATVYDQGASNVAAINGLRKNGEKLRAKWKHICRAYEIGNSSTQFRAMPKLTQGHVNPPKLPKMKVSCATQVFSYTVASVMELMTRTEGEERIRSPSLKNCSITINGIEAMYKLAANSNTYIRSRDFNQDPVENFFGQMR
ncbi:hypothetical protein Trydic_g10629 [Trypoxylus dichotomus]